MMRVSGQALLCADDDRSGLTPLACRPDTLVRWSQVLRYEMACCTQFQHEAAYACSSAVVMLRTHVARGEADPLGAFLYHTGNSGKSRLRLPVDWLRNQKYHTRRAPEPKLGEWASAGCSVVVAGCCLRAREAAGHGLWLDG